MNVFMTAGTFEYLIKLAIKYSQETMVPLVNENGALLLHETNGGTVFKEPRRYEVLDSVGIFPTKGLVVMNNIPVTDEGRPLFEHLFKNRAGKIENVPGFLAIRVLRPLASNTYVILTVWENEAAYQQWKTSDSFFEAHKSNGSKKGIDPQPKIFSSGSYVSKFTITNPE